MTRSSLLKTIHLLLIVYLPLVIMASWVFVVNFLIPLPESGDFALWGAGRTALYLIGAATVLTPMFMQVGKVIEGKDN